MWIFPDLSCFRPNYDRINLMNQSLTERLSVLTGLWLATAFLGGIALGANVPNPWPFWLLMSAAALLIGVIFLFLRRGKPGGVVGLLPFVLLLGAFYYQYRLPVLGPNDIAYYNDDPRKAWVTGVLVEPPDVRDGYENLRLAVRFVDFGEGDIPADGMVLVRVYNIDPFYYGDMVRVRGNIQTPPENEEFSYREYLSRQGINSLMSVTRGTLLPGKEINPAVDLLYKVKNSLLDVIYRLFPDPEASLLAGVLLGEASNIPPDLQDAFKNTGTSHIIAISGFNIAIIAGIFVTLFSRLLGTRKGALISVLGIAAYTILVGASASVVRAALMATLSILAQQIGRRNFALNALALVAVIMAIVSPLVLWDVGFQLSFAATLGLILYADPIEAYAAGLISRWLPQEKVQWVIGPLAEYVLLTFAAQVTTLPIIAYQFGRISIVSFIANPFILPFQPPVMLLGGLATLLGWFYQPLGQVLAFLAWPFPAYTIRMVEFFNGFPGGVIATGQFSLLIVILIYGVLFFLTFAGDRFPMVRQSLKPATVILTLAILTALTWRSVAELPDGNLHVTFLNVGSGDAILIKSPTGSHVLINGGPSTSRLSDQLGRRIPAFDRKLDYLVVASIRENELAALPRTLERYLPEKVLWSGNVEGSFSSTQLHEFLTFHDIPTRLAKNGDTLDLGGGARLEVIFTTPRGALLAIKYQDFSAILPLGVDFDTFDQLQNGQDLGVTKVLLLADGGYQASNPQAWIENLSPQLLVLSVGANDPDGLPQQSLLDAIEGYNLLRTDANGWIEITTDGQQMWIQSERKHITP